MRAIHLVILCRHGMALLQREYKGFELPASLR
jgi:hypothetical protein